MPAPFLAQLSKAAIAGLAAVLVARPFGLSGLSPAQSASAAARTFTVNSTADVAVVEGALDNGICETAQGNDVCTLRAAIMKANHYPGGGVTIRLPALPAGSLYLLGIPASSLNDETSGDLDVLADMIIEGGGAKATIIDGNASITSDRVLDVAPNAAVTISGVTIQHGQATNGGGISCSDCALALRDSTVVENRALSLGGGVFINVSNGHRVSVEDSTVAGNTAAAGGGIMLYGGALSVVNSTVSGNQATGSGGGIATYYGDASLYNVTVAYNRADSDLTGTGQGGGVAVIKIGTNLSVKNTIIGQNMSSAELIQGAWIAWVNECVGTLNSLGYNYIYAYWPSICTVNGPFVHDVDPLLAPLADNGGSTQTHMLQPGSPAIDAGDPLGCTDNYGATLTRDQRGYVRPSPAGGNCDIGAVEAGSSPPTPTATITPTVGVPATATPTSTATRTATPLVGTGPHRVFLPLVRTN